MTSRFFVGLAIVGGALFTLVPQVRIVFYVSWVIGIPAFITIWRVVSGRPAIWVPMEGDNDNRGRHA